MKRGSETRKANHGADKIFLDRWSPRAMSGEALTQEELEVLFEAAKWAPSSSNLQPWRILYARRDTEHWGKFLGLLVEFNQSWAKNGAALVVWVSKNTTDEGKPAVTHSFDTGSAWENFALQGALKGYVVHGMAGFDFARAKKELGVPDGYTVEAMAVVGKPGKEEALPKHLQEREKPSDRRPLKETAFEGGFPAQS
jgi:nitroreductase